MYPLYPVPFAPSNYANAKSIYHNKTDYEIYHLLFFDRLLSAADRLYDNTLILFTSDNGPAYQGSPGPFKGGKTDLHEGGIRVPMFAVWKEQIPANSYSFQTAHMADVLPTITEAAGIHTNVSDPDGINLLPELTRRGHIGNRGVLLWQMDLYRHFQNQGPKPKPYITTVATRGNWKLTADSLTVKELFNLAQDHRELYDLLGEQPAIEKELHQALKDFLAAPRRRWEDALGAY